MRIILALALAGLAGCSAGPAPDEDVLIWFELWSEIRGEAP